jgi:uncharacterized membrane protein YhaH (DUF805 family)
MKLDRLLFSFKGRISRGQYWRGCLFLIGLAIVVTMLAIMVGAPDDFLTALPGVFFLLYIIPSIALYNKRLHDRGKSGWFGLLGLIPVVGWWIAIEVMFLGSQEGENEYGPEPG